MANLRRAQPALRSTRIRPPAKTKMPAGAGRTAKAGATAMRMKPSATRQMRIVELRWCVRDMNADVGGVSCCRKTREVLRLRRITFHIGEKPLRFEC